MFPRRTSGRRPDSGTAGATNSAVLGSMSAVLCSMSASGDDDGVTVDRPEYRQPRRRPIDGGHGWPCRRSRWRMHNCSTVFRRPDDRTAGKKACSRPNGAVGSAATTPSGPYPRQAALRFLAGGASSLPRTAANHSPAIRYSYCTSVTSPVESCNVRILKLYVYPFAV